MVVFYILLTIAIVLTVVGLTLFFIRLHYDDKHDIVAVDDKLSGFFAGLFLLGSFGGIFVCGLTYLVESTYVSNYNTLVYEIHSLRTTSEVEGSGAFFFTIGYGSVKETSYYVYYSKTDKGLHLDKIETSNTYIIETDEITPSLYRVKEKGFSEEYYNLYVPKNTIREEYIF